MKGPTKKTYFFWPAILLVFLMIAAQIAGGIIVFEDVNISGNSRDQTLLENGFAQRTAEIAQLPLPQVAWDEAVRNLDNRFNYGWATENIGKYLHQTAGFDGSFVLNANDTPIFVSLNGSPEPIGRFTPYAAPTKALVAAIRKQESRAAAWADYAATRISQPKQKNTLAVVGSKLVLLTVSLVQSNSGNARMNGPRGPIVVTAMTVDQEYISKLANRYLVSSLQMGLGRQYVEDGDSAILLKNGRGEALATLQWKSRNIGSVLMQKLIVPSALVVSILAVMALLLIRRNRNIADNLIAEEARTNRLAYFDPLTGLPNRVSLHEKLEERLKNANEAELGKMVVLCIDLDRFKEVNDNYGHHSGDKLIRIAADRLCAQCGDEAFVARQSGDEFTILLSDTTMAAAEELAQRICNAMAAPAVIEAGRVFPGCSIGIALGTHAGRDCAEILRQADLALYRSKNDGKGRFTVFEPHMDDTLRMRWALEADLRQALEHDQLNMVYQPQVDRNGTVTGVEALMRWQHPARGPVSPSLFIPMADECGLIAVLGEFAFRRAFADSKQWPGLKVAINVSANQLRLPGFAPWLMTLVGECDVRPEDFELEITEGVLLGDEVGVMATLIQLRDMGFALALDDFGTGYSSLSYLQKFPVDKIKIDRSFIAGLGNDKEADAVVTAIIKLARALKLSVIAEGVETIDQRLRLASTGCWQVQGFLFSRPVPAGEIVNLLNAGEPLPMSEAA